MLYMNSRLCALIALVVIVSPGIRAQTPAASAPGTLRGDVDGDDRVTRADADAVRGYLVRGTLPGGRSIMPAGDANGDGRVTAADAALISRFAAGVDVSRFPVGRRVESGRGEPGGGGLQTGDQFCTVDVRAATHTCREVLDGGTGSQNVILGSPFVTFVTSMTYSDDNTGEDTANYSVRIRNATPQPLGTTDGATLAAGGIRLFFNTGPTVVASTGGATSIRLETPDGTATFTNQDGSQTYTSKPYFQYNEVLAPSDTTDPRSMQFIYSSNVSSFSYSYRVSAPAQFEHGWVTVAPATVPVLAPGGTASLTGTVYNQVGQVQADGITWSSSNTAVATVNASTGEVTAVDEGTTTITATSSVNAQRTGTRTVTVDKFPTVTSTTPANGATAIPVTDNIVINFSEAVNVTGSAFTLECPAGSSQAFTVSGDGTSAITLNPDADLPAAVVCTVVVDGNQVTDVDTNDDPNMMAGNYSFSFETAIQAIADAFGTTTTGNVRINSASTSPTFSVTTNDKVNGSTTITFAGWNAVAGKTMGGGDVVMATEGAGMGTFTYNPPAGFEGTDSLEYTITSGSASSSAKVALPVSGMIWFINNAGAACTTRASGCGRLTNPYSSLAAFHAENNGTGNNPAAGDNVFVYESATTYTGPVALLANQKLIGQDAGASLSTISGITPATGSDPLPFMNPAGNATTIAGASGGVVLGADNLLRGLSITTTGGTALSGTGFGTPTIAEVPISATGGAALSLDNGSLNSTFPSVSSTNSTGRGISLTNVNGSPTFTAGSISGAAQAAFLVNGGGVGFTWPGSIGQANNAPLVDVKGSHSGTLVFSGALTATNGTGLQFNAALGTYTFSGTANLNGGDAGVDITNGSTGTFNFNASTQITNPSGTGLNVYGSAPALVSYGGSITKNGTNPGRLVEIGEMTGGTVTFPVGSTLSSTSTAAAATGISLSNADGTVNFNGTMTLNGGDAGVDALAGTGGTIVFSANTSITNPSGTGLNVNASTPNLTFNGNITKNGTSAGRLVDVTGQTGGGVVAANNTITFQNGTLSSTSSAGTGILLNDVDGTVNFNGTTTLNGGDAGLDVIGGSAGSISFSTTSSISNPSGAAFLVSNSSPSLTYAGTITANSSRAVEVSNTSAAACGMVTFSGNLAGSGASASGFLVDRCNAGTINFSGASKSLSTQGNGAVTITNNGAMVNFTNGGLAITTTSGAGFSASGGGTVTVETGGTNNTVSSIGGGTAVNINGTSIGGGGVTFYSVNASGGGTNGIVLNNTGAGSFTVTGDGASDAANTTRGRTTAKSGGGTVALGSGGTITGKSGDGVSLSSTGAVVLRNMVIQNNSGDGVQATTASGVTIDNTRITGHTNNSGLFFTSVSAPTITHSEVENNAFGTGAPGSDIHNVRLISNTGTGSVQNSVIANTSAGAERQLQIHSTTGTLNIAVTNNRIGGSTVGDGVGVYAYGSSNITANFQNDSIHSNSSFGIVSSTQTGNFSGSLNLTVNNTALRNNALGVAVAHGSAGTNTFNITNNNIQTNVFNSMMAININRLASGSFNGFGLFSGTISGNIIGTAGTANSGSDTGSGIEVESNGSGGITRVAIVNNTIRQVAVHGIYVAAVDANTGGTAPPLLEARIASNSISNMEGTALDGIHVLPGALNTDDVTICVDIANNNSTGIRNGLRVRPSGQPPAPSTIQLEGWDGVTARETYFTSRPNTISGMAAYNERTPSAPGGFVAVAHCNTP